MQLLSFRLPARGKISIHVLAYQPGAENTKPALRELAARALAEFEPDWADRLTNRPLSYSPAASMAFLTFCASATCCAV